MYGSHAKWATEMLLPEATDAAARHARSVADRAVATALSSPRGPVHLNFPFREPLVPAPAASSMDDIGVPPQTIVDPHETWSPVIDIASLAKRLQSSTKGLIVCGPMDPALDRRESALFFPALRQSPQHARACRRLLADSGQSSPGRLRHRLLRRFLARPGDRRTPFASITSCGSAQCRFPSRCSSFWTEIPLRSRSWLVESGLWPDPGTPPRTWVGARAGWAPAPSTYSTFSGGVRVRMDTSTTPMPPNARRGSRRGSG